MTFRFETWKMAQALSFVAEQGIHGFDYNPIIEKVSGAPVRQSQRMRLSLLSAHRFTPDEFELYMILAWRFRYVDRSKYKEFDLKHGLDKSSYEIEDEVVCLTQSGWEYIEEQNHSLLERWLRNVRDNVPSILLAVVIAILADHLVGRFGFETQEQSTDQTE